MAQQTITESFVSKHKEFYKYSIYKVFEKKNEVLGNYWDWLMIEYFWGRKCFT